MHARSQGIQKQNDESTKDCATSLDALSMYGSRWMYKKLDLGSFMSAKAKVITFLIANNCSRRLLRGDNNVPRALCAAFRFQFQCTTPFTAG